MPSGEHPNSRKNLAKRKPFTSETGRAAQKKSGEAKRLAKTLTDSLKECCTPEHINKITERLISMAEHGNLKAYELIRDGLGEKPKTSIDISDRERDLQKMDEILKQLNMIDDV